MTLIQALKIGCVKTLLAFRRAIIAAVQRCLFRPVVNPKKILVHRIGTFGDSIVALPAVALIREHYPQASLEFVTTYATPINLSTIVASGIFDAVHLIDKKNRKEGLAKLGNGGYDLFIDIPQKYTLYKSLRNMFLARFYLNIPSAFGWDVGMTKLFAKEQMEWMPPVSEIHRFLNMLSHNGIEGKISFPLKQNKTAAIESVISETSGKKHIAFVIGTNVPLKAWPVEYWRDLALKMQQQGFVVILVGGAQEAERAENIVHGLDEIINTVGKHSISENAALLSMMDISVCHDTGAMHLSYAVGTPTIALMSTRDFISKWEPYGKKMVTISKFLPCSGCFRGQCDDNICMKQITVDEVYSNIVNICLE
jgi:ADP-heptose:LPS heptosyltransferase